VIVIAMNAIRSAKQLEDENVCGSAVR
jgi:hypothetical protein